MAQTIFYIILAILIADFLFRFILDFLNTTRFSDSIPAELEGIYDQENYRKSQQYLKANARFGMLLSVLSFLLMIGLVVFGLFGQLDTWIQSVTGDSILQALLFFGILALAGDLLSTPFSVYSTFIIEERFGFNKTTPKTFFLDKFKSWIILAVIGGGILALAVYLFERTGPDFWLWVWAVLAVFSVFISMFYSSLIVPLFNKQEKLEPGDLRDKIEAFAQKTGFTLRNIYTIDGSKRSTKANAYFTGLGAKKRIVLYDTLIEKQSADEIVAVLAHEIGHYRKKHIVSTLAFSLANSLVTLFILSLFIRPGSEISLALAQSLGAHSFSFHMGLLAFGILYGPISLVTGTFLNSWSRKNEFEADRFARSTGLANELKSALIKLSVDSLSNLRPHPAYVFFHYSHPTLLQRLKKLDEHFIDH
jgi:STE24 endopeptidase